MSQATEYNTESISAEILGLVSKLSADNQVNDNTPLIGDKSRLDSMKLVALCIELEDLATRLGFEFDWTSDTAMSRSMSMFRTAGSLTQAFLLQMREHE